MLICPDFSPFYDRKCSSAQILRHLTTVNAHLPRWAAEWNDRQNSLLNPYRPKTNHLPSCPAAQQPSHQAALAQPSGHQLESPLLVIKVIINKNVLFVHLFYFLNRDVSIRQAPLLTSSCRCKECCWWCWRHRSRCSLVLKP